MLTKGFPPNRSILTVLFPSIVTWERPPVIKMQIIVPRFPGFGKKLPSAGEKNPPLSAPLRGGGGDCAILSLIISIRRPYGRRILGPPRASPQRGSCRGGKKPSEISIHFFNIIWTFIANADTLKIIIIVNNGSVRHGATRDAAGDPQGGARCLAQSAIKLG